MNPTARQWALLAVIVAAALWLRTAGLGSRPMHADEANQAVKFGELLEHANYAFDARDHHGPTLYYCALVPAWLRGERSLAALTETTVRLTPVFFGLAGMLLTAALMRPAGPGPALIAAALVGVSPAAVYYSRYFIQETLLVAFTLSMLVSAGRWWKTRRAIWAVVTGVAVGLMQSTKATAPLFVLTAGGAAAVVWPRFWTARGLPRALLLASSSSFGMIVVCYTAGGTQPSGLKGALSTYAIMLPRVVGGSGHDKPWDYYLDLFLFRRDGGLVWDQSLFLLLALAGAVMAWRRANPEGGRIARFTGIYTGLVAIILSLTPYKTPWVVINLVPGLVVLAAGALSGLAERARWGRSAALGLLAVVLGWQSWQTCQAVFLKPVDPRNPYAYAHSAPDVLRLGTYLSAVAPPDTVKVISRDYWPLPWYLRSHERTGYWSSPPADCDGALVICSMEYADLVRARQRSRYREDFLGLRPGVMLVVFTAKPAE